MSSARSHEPEVECTSVSVIEAVPAPRGLLDPHRFGPRVLPLLVLGRGGMGDVVLAVTRGAAGFRKLVVLKTLRPELSSQPAAREMFLAERKLVAQLAHPNVVQAFEGGDEGTELFFAMEYLEGLTLAQLVARCRAAGAPLPLAYALLIVGDTLAGLHYAHELLDYHGRPLRLVHRDASPQNVFVTYQGAVKVLDFGVAKLNSEASHTQLGILKGKMAYAAPEQLMGETVDARTDVYAVGVMLWELLAGRRLHSGSAAGLLQRLQQGPPPLPPEVEVHPGLAAIVARALAVEPAERFSSAAAMRDALDVHRVEAGLRATHEELGAYLRQAFAADIEARRRTLAERLQAVDEADAQPRVSLSTSGVRSPSPPRDDGAAIHPAYRGTSETPPALLLASLARRRQRHRALLLPLLASVGGALVGVMGLRVLTRGDAPPPPNLVAESAAAPPPVVLPTETSAPAADVALPSAADKAPATPADSDPAKRRKATEAPRRWVAPSRPPPREASSPPPAPSAPAAALAPEPVGYLTLASHPWGKAYVDGRLAGETPLVHAALTAGPHVVRIDNEAEHLSVTVPITIVAGETLIRRVVLR